MADIFLSYKRVDKAKVAPIVALLEAQGWSVWWDTRISGGERWDAVIEREIDSARCVVVAWSSSSVDREKAYWVHVEANRGREHGILVPVLIERVAVPLAFSLIQARDLTDWTTAKSTSDQTAFIEDIRRKLEGSAAGPLPAQPALPPQAKAGAAAPASAPGKSKGPDATARGGKRQLLVALLSIAAIGVAIAAAAANNSPAGLLAGLPILLVAGLVARRGRRAAVPTAPSEPPAVHQSPISVVGATPSPAAVRPAETSIAPNRDGEAPSPGAPPRQPVAFVHDGAETPLPLPDLKRGRGFLIGRSETCDLVLPHKSVSRRHAQIAFVDGQGVCIRDVGSTHGTYLDNRRIGESFVALDGASRLQLGACKLGLRYADG